MLIQLQGVEADDMRSPQAVEEQSESDGETATLQEGSPKCNGFESDDELESDDEVDQLISPMKFLAVCLPAQDCFHR